MAWRALREAGLPFDLLRSEDVRGGALSRYRMIFVPGGWASNKISALGEQGREEIRRFVAAGGSYLGICGGAGMATEDGLGLLPIRRKPSRERVPSFSGPILLSCGEHAIWKGIDAPVFSVWWPSQFQVMDQDVRVLARYEEAQADAFSSDVNVADGRIIGWPDLEQRYGILLDPARLRGEPGVLEGSFGRGRVILSLIHFDMPGDRNGAVVLRNLWGYLASSGPSDPPTGGGIERRGSRPDVPQNVLAIGRRDSGGRCGADRHGRKEFPVVLAESAAPPVAPRYPGAGILYPGRHDRGDRADASAIPALRTLRAGRSFPGRSIRRAWKRS